jgi:hypothetical protein
MAMALIECFFSLTTDQVADPGAIQVRAGRRRAGDVSRRAHHCWLAGPLPVYDDKGGRAGVLHQVGRRGRVVVGGRPGRMRMQSWISPSLG